MNIVLFCEQGYAISILKPLEQEALSQNYKVLWFIRKDRVPTFTDCDSRANWTFSMQETYDFSPQIIFAPCNLVPYYLPGVKVQIFHGYAAEKKDHWQIRNYFDLYLTQGPFFTKEFQRLAEKHKDFEVVETGWTRQDWIFKNLHTFDTEKQELLQQHNKEKIVLYAPTFSKSITSIPHIKQALLQLVIDKNILLLIKFHPRTKQEWKDEYKQFAAENEHIIWIDDHNVSKYIFMDDVMISDTSSVVYEQLLLSKPVITLNTIATAIYWKNITDTSELTSAYNEVFTSDDLKQKCKWVVDNYDPYLDGKVCDRMFTAALNYIEKNGVPKKRKLNLWRQYTSVKRFGKIKR